MTTSNTPYAELVKSLDQIGDIAGELQDRVIKELKADPLYRGDPYDAPDDCESNPTIRVGDIRKLLATAPRAARAIEALEAERDGAVERLRVRDETVAALNEALVSLQFKLSDADRRVEEERERCCSIIASLGYENDEDGFAGECVAAIRSRSNATGEDKDGLTARNTVASPISQEGSIAPEALSEGMLVAAYKRGFEWCIENNADREYVGKAAMDYADRVLSASPSPPALQGVGGGWQDISTAPKHTEVIVAQPVGDAWIVGEAMLRTEDSEVPAWWWANTGPGDAGNDGPIYGKGPTHWMAMPSPPNCTEERGAVSGQDSSFRTCALEPTGAGANSTTPIPSVDDGRG